jgi:hypothetical protein
MTRHRLTEQQKAELANIKRLIASARGKSRTDSVKYFRLRQPTARHRRAAAE